MTDVPYVHIEDDRLPEWATEAWWREVGTMREDNFS